MNASQLRIEFDDGNLKEIDEAKKLYIEARKNNRVITDLEGNIIEGFRTYYKGFVIREIELKHSEFSARFFDETGDRRLIWDANDQTQVEEAMILFEEYLAKGWKAYSTREDGTRGRRIYGFDPDTLEIYWDEKTTSKKLEAIRKTVSSIGSAKKASASVKEKLNNFVDSMKSVKVVPRTYPG